MDKKLHALGGECQCYRCKYGAEALEEAENKSIIEYGWFAHLDNHDCYAPNHWNMHTHGLKENFDHYDLQVCMPANPQVHMTIFHNIVDSVIRKGKKILPDVDYDEFLGGGYLLRFIMAKESGREVLRMLVPNKNGKYEGEMFADQLTMLDHIL